MSRIVISYRRADSAAIAGRIFDRLSSHYGGESVFMDIDNIPFGTDFREHIRKIVSDSDILLAIVGSDWQGKTADGGSRIGNDADLVRVEIETALRQGTPVIPVLVDGAAMPSDADLPESMRDFAYINAAPIDVGRDFHQHMDRLIRSIDARLGKSSPSAPTGASSAAPKVGLSARLGVGLTLAAAIALIAVVGWVFVPKHWFATTSPAGGNAEIDLPKRTDPQASQRQLTLEGDWPGTLAKGNRLQEPSGTRRETQISGTPVSPRPADPQASQPQFPWESDQVVPYFKLTPLPNNETLIPKTRMQRNGGHDGIERTITLGKGDSISTVLRDLGATPNEIKAIATALGPRGRDNGLKVGQKLRILVYPEPRTGRQQPLRVVVANDSGDVEAIVALSDLGMYVSVDPRH